MTDVEKYLKDNDLLLFGWNPFFKGILSDEDRKMPIQKYCENFRFFCKHTDLLGAPIEITPLFSPMPCGMQSAHRSGIPIPAASR